MKKRKLVILALCMVLAFSLAACGGDTEDSSGSESAVRTSDTMQANSEAFPATEENENFTGLAQNVKAAWDEKYQYGALSVGGKGDLMENAFLTWQVNECKTAKEINGTSAGDGKKFVVVNITMTNTTDETFSSGNYEFRGIVGPEEDDDLDMMDAFYDEMLADEFDLDAGKSITGDLVIKVDEDVTEIIIDFESFYGDEHVDGANWVVLPL